MPADAVQFTDHARPSLSEQQMPVGGATRAIRQAAEAAGIDPLAELYNEALEAANDGHLRVARERLGVLIGLCPEDGESRLLLAKVLVAGQRWREALAALDEARAHGVAVPEVLRETVEAHLRAEAEITVEHPDISNPREVGELKALRQEARRLRSENARYIGRNYELERETRKWAWTTAGVASVAILFIAANLLFGGTSAPAADQVVVPPVPVADAVVVDDAAGASAPGAADAPPVAPPTADDLASRAAAALAAAPGLDGTDLQLAISGDSARLSGSTVTARQRRDAERAVKGVAGIESVDASGVTLLARTKGTVHTVKKGDTLSGIALVYYGESSKSGAILKANKAKLGAKGRLSLGQELTIPPID